jgi:hypothetical protein
MQQQRQQVQVQQDRRRQAWWYEQQRAGKSRQGFGVSPSRFDELGFLGRTVRGLLTIVLGLASVAAIAGAVVFVFQSEIGAAVVSAAGALVLLAITGRISRWGRSI